MKFKLTEFRGYGIEYTVFSGTKEECEDEYNKITSNYYDDLDDRRNGDGDLWGYAVEEDE